MTDARLTPANARVAASHLKGLVDAPKFSDGKLSQVIVSKTDLMRTSSGPRDRQLQYGAAVMVYDHHDGCSFVQSQADGYVGYVQSKALGPVEPATHVVVSRATHAYSHPDMKSPDIMWLGMGAQICVTETDEKFGKTSLGYVPAGHIHKVEIPLSDPVSQAGNLIGTPYLWGGNTAQGIDCSGLIQLAFNLCHLPCPGDSDMQQSALGQDVTDGSYQRNDLLFWQGHVAFVADKDTLLHANAHHMAVVKEPLRKALLRIVSQGDGPVTRHSRLRQELI